MQTKSTIEPAGRRRTVRARLLSVIRGDKYMVDAYPPAAPRGDSLSASHMKER
jgi:hypothetical protein